MTITTTPLRDGIDLEVEDGHEIAMSAEIRTTGQEGTTREIENGDREMSQPSPKNGKGMTAGIGHPDGNQMFRRERSVTRPLRSHTALITVDRRQSHPPRRRSQQRNRRPRDLPSSSSGRKDKPRNWPRSKKNSTPPEEREAS